MGGIILGDLSDHFPIYYIHFAEKQHQDDIFITSRSFNIKNKDNFTREINRVDWSLVLSSNDTQNAYSKFHQIITSVFNTSFPLKRKKKGYSNKISWLSPGLKRSIINKHRLHATYLKSKSPSDKSI
jgi:hypothetical protein